MKILHTTTLILEEVYAFNREEERSNLGWYNVRLQVVKWLPERQNVLKVHLYFN